MIHREACDLLKARHRRPKSCLQCHLLVDEGSLYGRNLCVVNRLIGIEHEAFFDTSAPCYEFRNKEGSEPLHSGDAVRLDICRGLNTKGR